MVSLRPARPCREAQTAAAVCPRPAQRGEGKGEGPPLECRQSFTRAPLSLAYGMPDPSLFPYAELAAATARVLQDPAKGAAALQYGRLQGVSSLLSMLSSKLNHDEGLSVRPDEAQKPRLCRRQPRRSRRIHPCSP